MSHLRFGMVAAVLLACGKSEPPKAATVEVPPAPASAPPPAPIASASPDASAPAALPALWTCDGGRGPAVSVPPPEKSPPPLVGQMSEAAAQAKRKYDAEKWSDAETELRRIVKGETGDDEGNKQLAEYELAIVLYRLDRQQEAAEAFRAIAKRSNHLKHGETLLWLSRIAEEHPERLTLEDFSTYSVVDVMRFNNDDQRAVFGSVAYLVGRERVAEKKDEDAKKLLAKVPEDHAYGAAAKKCLALAQK